MPNRSADWMAQAERDLAQARLSRREGLHEWACFAAQQAAEKAIEAVHHAQGQEAWGHVVARLLEELPLSVPSELIEKARFLDNFHVPARYPNGHPEAPPFEHYGAPQSEQALSYADEILAFARLHLARS